LSRFRGDEAASSRLQALLSEAEPPNAFTSGMFFAPLFCAKKVENMTSIQENKVSRSNGNS
jgi:hypothetical protein